MGICIVTGKFNSICVNDIRLIKAAKNHEYHVHLVIGVQGDNFEEKKEILESISGVNSVIRASELIKYDGDNVYRYQFYNNEITYQLVNIEDIKVFAKDCNPVNYINPKGEEGDKFQKFLNYASDTVEDWPDWKKNVLGGEL